jgi:hypothetical protein
MRHEAALTITVERAQARGSQAANRFKCGGSCQALGAAGAPTASVPDPDEKEGN